MRAAAIMMAMAGLAAGGAAASDERSLFHLPGEDDFRTQLIERSGNEDGWPFSADAGHLMCAYVTGRPTVYFVEQVAEDSGADPRVVVVTTDPLDLAFVNAGKAALFAPHRDIADLIRLVAPFESLGARLCDQPRGSTIGRGEL